MVYSTGWAGRWGGFGGGDCREVGGQRVGVSVFQLLGHLPWKDVTTEVTINRCVLVDRFLQVEIPETENKCLSTRSIKCVNCS